MSQDREGAEPGPSAPRWALGLQALAAIAAVGLALFWVARATRDAIEPANIWVRRLQDGDVEQRIEAARGLGSDDAGPSFRSKAADALIAALADRDEEVAAAATLGLAGLIQAERDDDLARTWADALSTGLRDPRPAVRRRTAAAFTFNVPPQIHRRSQAAADALAALISDPADGVAAAAIRSLAVSGTGEAGVQALTRALETAPAATDRIAAAHALGAYPDHRDEASTALLRGLKSEAAEVRKACHAALGVSPDVANGPAPTAALVPTLIEAASDPDRTTRSHVALLLARIGPRAAEAVPNLIAMLHETDDALDPSPFIPAFAPPPPLAAAALGLIAPGTPRETEAAEALAAVLRSPEGPGPIDGAVALALSRFSGDWKDLAVPRLAANLDLRVQSRPDGPASTTRDDASRVIEALGRLAPGTPREGEAVAALARALGSGFKLDAAEALVRFGPAATPALPRLREAALPEESWIRDALERCARRIERAASDASPKDREPHAPGS